MANDWSFDIFTTTTKLKFRTSCKFESLTDLVGHERPQNWDLRRTGKTKGFHARAWHPTDQVWVKGCCAFRVNTIIKASSSIEIARNRRLTKERKHRPKWVNLRSGEKT